MKVFISADIEGIGEVVRGEAISAADSLELDSPFIKCNCCELVDQERLRLRMLTKEAGNCNGITQ